MPLAKPPLPGVQAALILAPVKIISISSGAGKTAVLGYRWALEHFFSITGFNPLLDIDPVHHPGLTPFGVAWADACRLPAATDNKPVNSFWVLFSFLWIPAAVVR